ncbi:MAG: hemolysin family protein [Anaerolineales bacterium]|nr:hemolysin family protein [Anaerolineales bacterium]MDW8446984.1 hemolysin family protein [Anaerolineales bacterium]
MEFLVSDLPELFVVLFFIFTNAFFVIAEYALVTVRKTRLEELAHQGVRGAHWAKRALSDPVRMIATVQLGVTLSGLALGWIGEPALGDLLSPLFSHLSPRLASSLSGGLAFGLITFLLVVFGELVPKAIALQYAERAAILLAGPLVFLQKLFQPFVWILNTCSNLILRSLGIRSGESRGTVLSVEELRMMVTASKEQGVFKAEQGEMLEAILDIGQQLVRQVMIPRTEMIAVEAETPLPEIIRLAGESGYTKFPVYDESLDQILGIVHLKDLLPALLSPEAGQYSARAFAREALFVPETLTVRDLLERFRTARQHIAIVMDEFGGTGGLVTLEDLVEEIVGEVRDPFDRGSPSFVVQADGSILIDGMTLIEEVNEHLGLNLSDPYYDTIAGFVLGKLGRIPQVNDVVESDGVRLRVESMDGLRIARLVLERLS